MKKTTSCTILLFSLIILTILIPERSFIVKASAKNDKLPKLPYVLFRAAGCESSYEAKAGAEPRQFNQDGSIKIHVNKTSKDWGALMINDKIWDATAKKYKLDYKNSKIDNYKMGLIIYEKQGISAWKWSYNLKKDRCWWENGE